MAPAARCLVPSRRRIAAPLPGPPQNPLSSRRPRKMRSIADVIARAPTGVLEQRPDYSDVNCEQCGTGDLPEELLLCDKCDKGFHMKCVRPIVLRVPIGSWFCPRCSV